MKLGSKELNKRLFKIIVSLLLSTATIVSILLVISISFFPTLYVIIATLFFLIVLIISLYLIWLAKKSIVAPFLRNLFISVTSLSLVVIPLGIREIDITIFRMFSNTPKTGTSNIVILALEDDPLTSPAEIFTAQIAFQNSDDLDNQDYAIKFIENEFQKTLQLVEYEDIAFATDALLNKKCRFLLINAGYIEVLQNDAKYEELPYKTKKVYEVVIEYDLTDMTSDTRVTEEAFNIYISGTDSYGKLNSTYRSDVNLILTINPKTKQLLITSLPRDTYLKVPCWNNVYDKLTHTSAAGWRKPSGVSCSMKSLEQHLDIQIDFYIKINFTSLITIVDTLGGITVDNPYTFTFSFPPKNTYQEGLITLNGQQALQFVRERKSLKNGDMDRNLHQLLVIKALLKKALQPSTLAKSKALIESLSSVYETNITPEQISALIKMQLSDFASWDVHSQAIQGQLVKKISALLSKYSVYTMNINFPNQLEAAKLNIADIMAGKKPEVITLPEGIKQNVKSDKPKTKPGGDSSSDPDDEPD